MIGIYLKEVDKCQNVKYVELKPQFVHTVEVLDVVEERCAVGRRMNETIY